LRVCPHVLGDYFRRLVVFTGSKSCAPKETCELNGAHARERIQRNRYAAINLTSFCCLMNVLDDHFCGERRPKRTKLNFEKYTEKGAGGGKIAGRD